MICSLTNNIDEAKLSAITNLEKDLGKTLLAFSCHALNPSSLSADELQKVQDAEKKLGVSLVVVEA
jgi:hypothetical protein